MFVCVFQLDSWSVILNGAVEVIYLDGRSESVCMGGSFGVCPSNEKQLMTGVMRTKVDDCQVSLLRIFTWAIQF